MNKSYLHVSIFFSLIFSISTLFVYHHFCILKFDQTVENNKDLALRMAETEIQFSDRFKSIFSAAQPNDFIKAANDCINSVVSIQSEAIVEGSSILSRRLETNNGSGVVFNDQGYIVTNHHVVKNAERITVLLNNQKEYSAELIGNDPNTDLAVIKINERNLPYLVMGNSDSVRIGEWVMAVGNPFKLQSTVTAGIVSAKGRSINLLERTGIESFIQTDAAVNKGNSGGALVNTNGELIGINTAILSEGGNYEGFSFAVPSNIVRKVVKDIIEYGSVQRGWLGVEIVGVDNDIAELLGLKEVGGAYIEMVYNQGAAQIAGIRKGDVILSVNDIATNTVSEFMEQLAKYRPGDKISLYYFRNGVVQEAKAILKNQINTTEIIENFKNEELVDFGIELRSLSIEEKMIFRSQGYMVSLVYKNSEADMANINPGYVITTVNDQNLNNIDLLLNVLKQKKSFTLEGGYKNYPEKFKYELRN